MSALFGRPTALKIWLGGAVVWLAVIAAAEAPSIAAAAQQHADAERIVAGELPPPAFALRCEEAQGLAYIDYRVAPAAPGGQLYCLYEVGSFRRHYPEYRSVSDADLYLATWEKTGRAVSPAATAHALNREWLGAIIEFAGPVVIAGLVLAGLRWWMGGSAPRRRKDSR